MGAGMALAELSAGRGHEATTEEPVTFDFAPDDRGGNFANVTPFVAPPRLPVASKPAFAIAHFPTSDELASLVGELFQEGSLTWEQICSLAELPGFGTRLLDVIALSPATRKPMAAE